MAKQGKGRAFVALRIIRIWCRHHGRGPTKPGPVYDYDVTDIGDGFGVTLGPEQPRQRLVATGNGLAAHWGGWV